MSEQTKSLALPIPVTIRLGQSYELISGSEIIRVKVVKIIQNQQGDNAAIFFTTPNKHNGSWLPRDTVVSTNAADFKQRILAGGLEEIIL